MDKKTIFYIIAISFAFFLTQRYFAPQEPVIEPSTEETPKEQIIPPTPSTNFAKIKENEQLYVLENQYCQLVFSDIGGSLSEINLPIKGENHPSSIINPVSMDTEIAKKSPENDKFPSRAYFIASSSGSKTSAKPTSGGYYPLLRRDIFDSDNKRVHALDPALYSCSIVTSQGAMEYKKYSITKFTDKEITFEGSENGKKIQKTFRINDDPAIPYLFHIDIASDADTPIFLSSGIPEAEIVSGDIVNDLKYRMEKTGKASVEKVKNPKEDTVITGVFLDWTSNSNGYFGIILDPQTPYKTQIRYKLIPGDDAPSRVTQIDAVKNRYPIEKYPGYINYIQLARDVNHFHVYAGPYQNSILKAVDSLLINPKTDQTPNFISAKSFHGWFAFVSEPFAKFLFFLMEIFFKFTHSWGLSIILITVVLRLLLYPLNNWSIRSTAKMQELAPKIKKIQEKYKDDQNRARMEIMLLYKEEKANPFVGCLPMLIQLPFLFGMLDLLKSTFELRGASFIPGWINNLTQPDVIYSWKTNIFFIGNELHLLPLILGALMFVQQKYFSNMPKDNSTLSETQKQQKLMGNTMAIVFTFMFYNFPSGLNIYWLFSTLLGIVQQVLVTPKPKK